MKNISRREFISITAPVIAGLPFIGCSGGKDKVAEAIDPNLPVPREKYLIAFSNGDMGNSWRWAFAKSMEEWAKKYRYIGPGIKFRWANGHGDSARQLMDCDTLLAMNPDILILSPNQGEPLDPVIDMATEAEVPLMVIDRSLVREPGTGTYFCNITQNFAFTGMYQAVYVLAWLKAQYGSYKGNIVEIQGLIGASPNTDEYVGIRSVLRHYPDVKIIGTGEGKYAQNEGRKVMEGHLERFRPGEIDLVICYSDSEALGALEAIEASGRKELLTGRLLGKDQMVSFVKEILAGRALMTTECSPYYGPFTIPAAVKYLNGDEKPEKKQYLPLRCWENPNDEIDLTPAINDKDIYHRHIAYAEERDLALIPPETGDYEELHVDLKGTKGYEEVLTYSRTKVVPADLVDLQNA